MKRGRALGTAGSGRDSSATLSSPSPAEADIGLQEAEAALLQLARTHARAGRWADAAGAYEQFTRRRPDVPDVWSELAASCAAMGDTSRAIAASRQLVLLRPDDAGAWYRQGVLLCRAARHADAIAALREALRLDPELAAAWHALGLAERATGQHAQSLTALRRAVQLDPRLAQAWYRLGSLCERDEDYAEAIRCYREAVRGDRDYALAWHSLAVLCREQGWLEEATQAFLENLRIRPRDVDTWLGLGMTYEKRKDRRGVLDVYEQLAILDPATAETFGQRYVEAWSPARASVPLPPLANARQPSGRGTGHPLADTWYAIGVMHKKQGQVEEALSDFAEAVRFDANHAKAWFRMASLLRARGRHAEALHALREVSRLKPRLATVWSDIAAIHALRGDRHKAARAFRKALQIAPDDPTASRGLAHLDRSSDDSRANAEGPAAPVSLAGGASLRNATAQDGGALDALAAFDVWLRSLRGAEGEAGVPFERKAR